MSGTNEKVGTFPVEGESELTVVYVSNGVFLESREKFYRRPTGAHYSFFIVEKLDVSNIFKNESRKKCIGGINGYARYDVSRTYSNWG